MPPTLQSTLSALLPGLRAAGLGEPELAERGGGGLYARLTNLSEAVEVHLHEEDCSGVTDMGEGVLHVWVTSPSRRTGYAQRARLAAALRASGIKARPSSCRGLAVVAFQV